MKKTLKKIVSVTMAFLMVLGCFAMLPGITGKTVYAATSGECGDNLTWTFENGTLTISGTGDMWDLVWDEDECNYIYPDGWYNELDSIEKIVIEDGVTSISDNAFSDLSVTEITIADSVKNIGDYAFAYTLVSELNIPDSVENIGIGAFEGNFCLETINIGAGVSSIGEMAFSNYLGDSDSNTSSLTAINVDSDNEYFSSVDGVLFDKAGTTLICYPNGKSAASYEVPDGVTTIKKYAFDWCLALKSITLPSTLSTVEEEVFTYCDNLKTVNYNGTKTDWSKISIAKTMVMDYGDGETETVSTNDPLLNATMVYNSSSDDSSSSTPTLKITASSLNVRKGAGTSYGILTSVKKGKTYTYTATKKVGSVTWYKIKVNNSVSGWVSGKYVKVNAASGSNSGSSTTSGANTLKITASYLNVRKGAGTGYGIITSVKKGNTYTYTATKKVGSVTWYKIKVSNSISGWVSGKYISRVSFKVTVTARALNVRKGAGTGYGIITSVKKGNSYTCTATKKVSGVTWYKIKVNNSVTGWISGKYAKAA